MQPLTCDHHGKRCSSSPVRTGGDISQLSKGGWGVGGLQGEGREGGAGSLTPSSFGESLPPGPRSRTRTVGVCTASISVSARQAAARTHVHTARQAPRSIRRTPMMRGCSSRSKLAQSQGRAGKRRRFRAALTGVCMRGFELCMSGRMAEGRAALQDVNKSRRAVGVLALPPRPLPYITSTGDTLWGFCFFFTVTSLIWNSS